MDWNGCEDNRYDVEVAFQRQLLFGGFMTRIPSDEILESLYKLRMRESEKLKTVLELYNLEIHQKEAGPDYHRLRTMVKRSIEQNLRMKNLGARNGYYETSAVVKNQRAKKREQRSLGDCWQWRANEGFSGVVSLIGSLVADLAKESQEAKVEEDHSQQEYEAFMAESAASRAEKVKEVAELEDAKAAVSASLVQSKEELVSAVTSATDCEGDECVASELRLVAPEL